MDLFASQQIPVHRQSISGGKFFQKEAAWKQGLACD